MENWEKNIEPKIKDNLNSKEFKSAALALEIKLIEGLNKFNKNEIHSQKYKQNKTALCCKVIYYSNYEK